MNYIQYDDGVALGIAESRESPSTIVNHKIDTRRFEELMIEAWRYAKRKRDDTQDEDGTIRETKTGRYARRRRDDTRYRKEFACKNATTRQHERDDTRRKERDDTWQKEWIRCTTILNKWAPGANNRATLIYFTNLEINPAAPRSVCGREAWFF